jgi:hypothetical protein
LINDVPDRPGDRGVHRARAAAAVVATLTIVVAGCGGGSDEGGTDASDTTSTTPSTSTSATSTTTTEQSTTSTETTTEQVGAAPTTIRQAVDAVLVSADSDEACGSSYVTQRYLEMAYGGKQGCVQAQSSNVTADSVHFDDVTLRMVTGTDPPRRTASAKVVPDGGLYGGDELTVSLVKEDGNWKVDELKSNAPVGP